MSGRPFAGDSSPLDTVTDLAQLEALKAGDTIDLTFYESRLVSVERPKQ